MHGLLCALQAGIFQYAKQITDAQAGESVVDTVVVVPAWFGVVQRQAVIDAASLAGLNVLGLMNGHAAAALQFGIERDFAKKEQTVSARHFSNWRETSSRKCRCSCCCVLQRV
jgi:hypoxia up-regulated 1